MTWRRSNQQHAAGLRTGVSERVRCAGWDKYASSRAAAHGTLATAQIEVSFENVKDLLDFGVVMRTSVQPWRDRKLKQRAVLRVFGRDQIIDPSLMQGDTVSLTVSGPVAKPQQVQAIVRRVGERAGIEGRLTPHRLRRTYGSYLINATVRLESVSKLLGHANTSITERAYAQMLALTYREKYEALLEESARDGLTGGVVLYYQSQQNNNGNFDKIYEKHIACRVYFISMQHTAKRQQQNCSRRNYSNRQSHE